jgi:hypothetical protein
MLTSVIVVITVIIITIYLFIQYVSTAAFPKLVGCEKFLKCDFFNYIKIKNLKKWESEKTKQN